MRAGEGKKERKELSLVGTLYAQSKVCEVLAKPRSSFFISSKLGSPLKR